MNEISASLSAQTKYAETAGRRLACCTFGRGKPVLPVLAQVDAA
jgi:hypothetical protein